MTSNLYLDIGNSFTKWKFKSCYFERPTREFSLDVLPKASQIWVSCVSPLFDKNTEPNLFYIESQSSYKSLRNAYIEPNLLGSDRWLALIAGYELCLKSSYIVVDIGTAVTIDVVDSSGIHKGGVIFPGLMKIRNSFDCFKINNISNVNILGQSTEEAWSIGTLNLLVDGINQKVRDLKIAFPNANIFITGGGFEEIESLLDFSFDFHENLVLDGLELYANYVG